jgi:hypothetical protein
MHFATPKNHRHPYNQTFVRLKRGGGKDNQLAPIEIRFCKKRDIAKNRGPAHSRFWCPHGFEGFR